LWGKFHPEILRRSPRAGALNKGGLGKISRYFLALSVNISKTAADTAKVTIVLMTNRKSHELSTDTKIDDLGLP